MLARVADGLFTHINGLDRHSITLACTYLLLETGKSCLIFSITTEVDLTNVLFVLFLTSVQLQLQISN